MKTNLLINNKSVQGNADAFDVINPFNSEIIASIAQSSICTIVNQSLTKLRTKTPEPRGLQT